MSRNRATATRFVQRTVGDDGPYDEVAGNGRRAVPFRSHGVVGVDAHIDQRHKR